jgi:hemerythrin-like domain-containing protein
MNATQTLREEHQLILTVLSSFQSALARARESRQISRAVFEPFLEFFRGFADRCHHGKEEDKLFPCLQRCGLPGDCGPIAVMLEEHQRGRFHVRSMAECLAAAESGDPAAVDAFLRHGAAFLDLLRDHIGKEDHVLFQIADEIVQGEVLSQLTNSYGDAERERDYEQTYQRCRGIADRLVSGSDCADEPSR